MKTALYAIVIVVLGAGFFALGWFSRGYKDSKSNPALAHFNGAPMPPGFHPPNGSPMQPNANSRPTSTLAPNEWQEFRTARQNVLQNDPELSAEYKEILKEMQDQQTALEQAMIKADPNVAPIVAKLQALRQQHAGGAPVPPGANVPLPR